MWTRLPSALTVLLSALALGCAPSGEQCEPCAAAVASVDFEEVIIDRLDVVEAAFVASGLPTEPMADGDEPSTAFLDFVALNAGLGGADDLRLERYEADGFAYVDVLPATGAELALARARSGSDFEHGLDLEAYSAQVQGPGVEGAVGPSYLHMSGSVGPDGGWGFHYMSRISTEQFGAEHGVGTTLFVLAQAYGPDGAEHMRYCSSTPCGRSDESLACIDVVFAEPCEDCDVFTELGEALALEGSLTEAPEWSCKDRNEKVMIF